ncbi:hypothetical protein [uncultured Desulfovibrio sp.]|uniref:hypothetical protein n=1 Tax=uncultured Desulfovibrio sp. TaxID=167968 RepID=UPI002619422A|nr:hypothetical protein [uncultured Desulfovibrio sp.]
METVSTTASNGNPTSENVHEQLLSLLGELTDKLTPAPAPKPEKVKVGQIECLAPFTELREAIDQHMKAVIADAKEFESEVRKTVRAYPPCESERAWETVFKRGVDQLHNMVDVLIWHTGTIQQQVFHLAQLVVLAAEGNDDLLYPLRYGVNKEGESHE